MPAELTTSSSHQKSLMVSPAIRGSRMPRLIRPITSPSPTSPTAIGFRKPVRYSNMDEIAEQPTITKPRGPESAPLCATESP